MPDRVELFRRIERQHIRFQQFPCQKLLILQHQLMISHPVFPLSSYHN